MKKPTIEKKVKTVAKKVRETGLTVKDLQDITRRVERSTELLKRDYDTGAEMLHQCRIMDDKCKESTNAIMEACATIYMAEQSLAKAHRKFRKQFIKYFFINLAFTAALVMVAVYVKD